MTPGRLDTYPDAMKVRDLAHFFNRSRAWADEQLRAGRFPYIRPGRERIIGREMLRRVLSGELVRRDGEWVSAATPAARGAAELGK